MTGVSNEHPSQNHDREFQDPVEAIKFHMEQKGLTQRDLIPLIGSRSKVSEVLSGTRSLTMPMARALHRHLGIAAEVLLKEPSIGNSESAPDIDWRRFPLSQMAKRGWIRDTGNLREDAEELVTELIKKAGYGHVAEALYRKNDHKRANAKTNPYALSAWCWRILARANERDRSQSYQPIPAPSELMTEVARLSPAVDGPLRAVAFLADKGIAVETERHLPGTHLDGAAMKSADGFPVIGLTLRYDRIDHFWHTLEHELAHVLFHLGDNRRSFMDDLGLEIADDKEVDADNRAREALIPADIWESSEVSDNPTPTAVFGLAHELGIHPGIVAGRYRYENQDYRRLSQFVGNGAVRNLFDL